MQIIIKTAVEQDYHSVFSAFDINLFKKLKPPGIGLKIIRFDGCSKGDTVELELNFGLFRQKWKSTITESGENADEYFFVDSASGTDLPFFLSDWKHCHRISKNGEGTVITDEISFKSPWYTDLLVYPAIWSQMIMRKPVYRKVFRKTSVSRE